MRLLLILLLSTLSCCTYCGAAVPKPNFVIILADDLGYGDVHCYNPTRGKIPTPNIDRLASEGIRFTDGHCSSACCSPSRYALLTGRYHWRSRLQHGICQLWEKPLITPERMTIANLAQKQGYVTGCIGKWHLGWNWPIPADQMQHFKALGGQPGGGGKIANTTATDEQRAAWKRAFSQSIPGGPTAVGFNFYYGTDVPNWPPYCFIENDRTRGIPTELLPAKLLERQQASLQGPALKDWTLEPVLPSLALQATQFIRDSSRNQQPFLLYLPLTSPHTPIAPAAQWKGKNPIGPYGDFVMQTDSIVGRVLDALKSTGTEENTFVIFTSDNGCARVAGVEELEAKGHFPSGPLRDYKASVYEGGHRIPFIVRWPGVVKPGSVSHQLVHQADLFATVAGVLNVPVPENAAEDSFSLIPLLKGEDAPPRTQAVNTSAPGQPSFRNKNWKLILPADKSKPIELYDLATDLAEKNNVAGQNSQLVADMQVQFEQLITNGRSTPGAVQKNDVDVVRYRGKP